MKALLLLFPLIVISGCTSPSNPPTVTTSIVNNEPLARPPASPPAASPPPPAPAEPAPSATTPAPAVVAPRPVRTVAREFRLEVADSRAPVGVAPVNNCVSIDANDTQILGGIANATANGGAALDDLELMSASKGGSASVRGALPLELEVPAANLSKAAGSVHVLLQVPEASAMSAAEDVVLRLTLDIRGDDPTFAVMGCRVGG